MNSPVNLPPPLPVRAVAASTEETLRRLYLSLFLRGRGARGLKKDQAPKSVGSKLAMTLGLYALLGLLALAFIGQSTFALSAYLHAMTLMFVGMFVASSSGEMLFNKEEADILLHRPVAPRQLLWAKVGVLVQVSIWLAGAFNWAGMIAGAFTRDGGWLFPVLHAFSTVLNALFCVSSVVLVYQLCLRWFGRERLDALMTTAQVFMAVGVLLAGQAVPQLMTRFHGKFELSADTWWVWLLPPTWFAGLDDAIARSGSHVAWILAFTGFAVTAFTVWSAFGRLAEDYGSGLQKLNERSQLRAESRPRRRWLSRVVQMPPLSWWLNDSVSRATFLLVTAYLVRDRDVKLRVLPGLAPFLIMPFVMLVNGTRGDVASFGIAFAGSYLAMAVMLGMGLLRYSQQWQAADVFRAAPLPGPAPLSRGLRRAVLLMLAVPMIILYGIITWSFTRDFTLLSLLLPGIIFTPIGLLVPCVTGEAVPLAEPPEEAKSAGRGAQIIVSTFITAVVAGLSLWAWRGGWFGWFLLAELFFVIVTYLVLRPMSSRVRWSPME
ncbi:MAG: hypothetical protein FJ405_07510 [Verrucomicrobia bacterium]|nr:hypothetical protein [Verrucomicrobiota bacterium]